MVGATTTRGRLGAPGRGGRLLPPAPTESVRDVRMEIGSALMQWVADEACHRGCSTQSVIADAIEHYRTNTVWPIGPST